MYLPFQKYQIIYMHAEENNQEINVIIENKTVELYSELVLTYIQKFKITGKMIYHIMWFSSKLLQVISGY